LQLLLTGGSGFLGTSILPLLVRDDRFKKIHILIRDSAKELAAERVQSLVTKVFKPEDRPLAQEKLIAAVGDLTLTKLGLSGQAYKDLTAVCTHVLHVGASTDFAMPLAESRAINVEGTRRVLDFAVDCKNDNPGFVRVDYVSTAFVAGIKPGSVSESDLNRGQGFANAYEQTKYESELLVREYFDRLPIAIERPSIVVGDSRNGFTPHFKVLYWPLLLLAKNILPFIPCNPKAHLDIVPVDYVSKGLYAILTHSDSIGKTFYLTAGTRSKVTIGDFLRDAFSMTSIQKRPLMPLWFFKGLRSRWFRSFMSEDFWQACELAAVYSEYIRGTEVLFDNSQSESYLRSKGVTPSPAWSDYKKQVFGYCMDTKWGKRRSQEEWVYRNP
jgi:thioester reductase-like protein